MRSRLTGFLKRPAVVAAAAVLILRALTLSSRFLLSVLLARMLSPEEMGQYGLVTACLAFALLALGLEFYSHTLRELVPASPDEAGADHCRSDGARNLNFPRRRLFSPSPSVSPGCFRSARAVVHPDPGDRAHLAGGHANPDHHLAAGSRLCRSLPARRHLGLRHRRADVREPRFAFAGNRPDLVGAGRRGIDPVCGYSLRDLPWRELRNKRPDWAWIGNGLRVARPFMLTAAGALTISYVDRFMIDGFRRTGCARHLHVLFDDLDRYSFAGRLGVPAVPAQNHRGLVRRRGSLSHVVRSFFWSLRGRGCRNAGAIRRPDHAVAAVLQLAQYAASVGVFFLMLPGVLLRILADVPSYALYAAKADTSLLICNLGSASRPFCSISSWSRVWHLRRGIVRQHRQWRAFGRAVGAGAAQDAETRDGNPARRNGRSSDGCRPALSLRTSGGR